MKVKELMNLLQSFDENEEVYVFDVESDVYDIATVDQLEHYQTGVHIFPNNRQYAYEYNSSQQYDLFYNHRGEA